MGENENTTSQATTSTAKGMRNIIGISFITLASAGLLFLLWTWATGTQINIMLSSSMAPEFPRGSMVLTQAAPYSNFHKGDIIGFQQVSGSVIKIHRVVEATSSEITTQGDAIEEPDVLTVTPQTPTYKVIFYSPLAGYLWAMFPYLLIGVGLSFVLGFFVKSLDAVAIGALLCICSIWAIGIYRVSPSFSADTLQVVTNTQDVNIATIVNAGLAPLTASVVVDGVESAPQILDSGGAGVFDAGIGEHRLDLRAHPSLNFVAFLWAIAGWTFWFIMVIVRLLARKKKGAVDD